MTYTAPTPYIKRRFSRYTHTFVCQTSTSNPDCTPAFKADHFSPAHLHRVQAHCRAPPASHGGKQTEALSRVNGAIEKAKAASSFQHPAFYVFLLPLPGRRFSRAEMSLFDSDTPPVRRSFYLKSPRARVTTARRCGGADKCVSDTQGAHLYPTYNAPVNRNHSCYFLLHY